MKKRTAEGAGKTQATKDLCVVRSWLRRNVSRKDRLTLCSLCAPCALCVSLGLVKAEIGR